MEKRNDSFLQYLVDEFVPLVLFINPQLDVLYANGELERYFALPRALVSFNLRKMLDKEVLLSFTNGVDLCRQDRRDAVKFHNVRLTKNGIEQSVCLQFRHLNIVEGEEVILVELYPESDFTEERSDSGREVEQSSILKAQVLNLEWQLKEAKQEAKKLLDEQEATNEELHTANRELMASNEELQATNEELQSVNEELYAVNRKLQNKDQALVAATDDIFNLLRSKDLGTIFLDVDFRIKRVTPEAKRKFNLTDIVLGKSISHFHQQLGVEDILGYCRKVYEQLKAVELHTTSRHKPHIKLQILPYRTQDHVISGIIITVVEQTEMAYT